MMMRSLITLVFLFASAQRVWFFGTPAVTTYKFIIMNPANGYIFNPGMGDFEASAGLSWEARAFGVTEDPCNPGYYYATANGGRLDLLLDDIKAKTDLLNFTGTGEAAKVKALVGAVAN